MGVKWEWNLKYVAKSIFSQKPIKMKGYYIDIICPMLCWCLEEGIEMTLFVKQERN